MRQVNRQMALPDFEALQRATLIQAAQYGIDRPAAMAFGHLSQDDLAAVRQGRTTIAQHQQRQVFSSTQAADMRASQIGWIKRGLAAMLGRN